MKNLKHDQIEIWFHICPIDALTIEVCRHWKFMESITLTHRPLEDVVVILKV